MPMELAAAAFVRGAARSTAAEPWKATARPPTHLVLSSPPAQRRLFLSSTSPPDAPHRRRNLTMNTNIQEHASGRQGLDHSCSRLRNFLPTNDPRSGRLLAVAPWRHAGGSYSNRSATSIRSGPTFADYFSLYPVNARLSPSAGSTAGGPVQVIFHFEAAWVQAPDYRDMVEEWNDSSSVASTLHDT